MRSYFLLIKKDTLGVLRTSAPHTPQHPNRVIDGVSFADTSVVVALMASKTILLSFFKSST